jgi:hypothetical protein
VVFRARVDMQPLMLVDLQKRMDSSTVVDVRNALELDQYRPEEAIDSLRQYRHLLAAKFDKDRHRSKLTMSDFLAHDVGCYWQKDGACLFMLSGRNERGVSLIRESWLSPAAVDLTLRLLSENRQVAFEVCDETSTLGSVLSRLIFQLLEKNPSVVRRVEEWYKIQSLLARHDTGRDEALTEALLEVIRLQKEPVFIILDRPELSEDHSVKDYASAMLDVLENLENDLKVLVIHRADLWDWEENKKGVLRKGMGPEICRAIRLDQRRL